MAKGSGAEGLPGAGMIDHGVGRPESESAEGVERPMHEAKGNEEDLLVGLSGPAGRKAAWRPPGMPSVDERRTTWQGRRRQRKLRLASLGRLDSDF